MLGQFATTAFAGFFLAQHLAAMWLLSNGHAFSPEEILLAYASALPPPVWPVHPLPGRPGCLSCRRTDRALKQYIILGVGRD